MTEPPQVPDDCPLTARQLQVARLVARGLSNRQIALRLSIEHSTVRSHMVHVYARLGLNGKRGLGQLIVTMIARGWLRDDDMLEPGYTGPAYSTTDQHGRRTWLPSPAQRLYLDAFDRLLRERTERAAEDVELYFGVMCRAHGVQDTRPSDTGSRDIDELLLKLAAALSRPVPLLALQAA